MKRFPGVRFSTRVAVSAAFVAALTTAALRAEDWTRWRGPHGNAVTRAKGLPVAWSGTRNVRWKTAIPGEGVSSPSVTGDRIFLTSSKDDGGKRFVHCLDRATGKLRWSRFIPDKNPEITSAVTGYAAATPATDGQRVVAFFGNAGAVCYSVDGKKRWHRSFGEFDTELGLASSPVIHGKKAFLVCDHDGDRFCTFDSFLIALDVRTGKTVWKTDRRGLYRSWSTPIVVTAHLPLHDGRGRNPRRRDNSSRRRSSSAVAREELIVNAQDALRAYDPATGRELWKATGMTGWVTPSPVYSDGLIFATSGKTGPVLAVRPGGSGDVTKTRVVWKHDRFGPYVCSPVYAKGLLYVHSEAGVLTCYEGKTGKIVYRKRLEGKFWSSSIAGDGKLYITSETGRTYVLRDGRKFELLAKNDLGEECYASPVPDRNSLLIRTMKHLYCISGKPGAARRPQESKRGEW